MEFRIADSFTDSLARLTGDEQKQVKTTTFDLQLNPASPGMSFHKLDRAKDKHFWSVRVGSDMRLIVHRSEASLLLCYVDHHDKAYEWAERRKLETHPKTGAAQLIEIRAMVKEVIVPIYVQSELPLPATPAKPAPATGAQGPGSSNKGFRSWQARSNLSRWASLNSDTSRPFKKPKSGRIAVKVINHLGDEVMKVFRVS